VARSSGPRTENCTSSPRVRASRPSSRNLQPLQIRMIPVSLRLIFFSHFTCELLLPKCANGASFHNQVGEGCTQVICFRLAADPFSLRLLRRVSLHRRLTCGIGHSWFTWNAVSCQRGSGCSDTENGTRRVANNPIRVRTQPSPGILQRAAPNEYQVRAMLQSLFANHIGHRTDPNNIWRKGHSREWASLPSPPYWRRRNR